MSDVQETTTAVVETPKSPAKKAKKSVKKPTKKTKAKKASTKGKYIMPDQVHKEIRWTPAKQALLKALRKVHAFDAQSAKTAEAIAKASNGALEEGQVKHQCNPLFDLSQQGIIDSVKLEGDRHKSIFLTKKGQKVDTTPAA